MDDLSWFAFDGLQRAAYRARSAMSNVTLNLGDDSQPVQYHQTTGHIGEVRNKVVRVQQPGHSSMPLPGAKGVALYPGGHRGAGIIVAVDDPRYRPTGLKPGEALFYAIAGAAADGTGGRMQQVLKATVDGHGQLTGVEIDVGDAGTVTVNIKASANVFIQAPATAVSNGGATKAVKLADGSNSTTLFAQ